jgi:hypothetical protein
MLIQLPQPAVNKRYWSPLLLIHSGALYETAEFAFIVDRTFGHVSRNPECLPLDHLEGYLCHESIQPVFSNINRT